MNITSPTLSDRLLSLACYLGLAPLARIWRPRSDSSFFQHHFTQAMAALCCFLLLFLAAFFSIEVVLSALVIRFPYLTQPLAESWGSLAVYVGYAYWLPVMALVALWMTALGSALVGSAWQVPLLKRLTQRAKVIRFSFFANSLLLALVPLVAVLALYATSMTRRSNSSKGAAVHFLYDEGISAPRWVYALGLIRISLQAESNWGKGSTVLDPLTQETLRAALAEGKVVILATHGINGYIRTTAPENLAVYPAQVGIIDEGGISRFLCTSVLAENYTWEKPENVPVGSRLELAYIFGCNAGKRAEAWEKRLSPAKVILYDRLSSVFWDHAPWFAFTGPPQLKKLK